jgi:hypothetical protein
VESSALRTRERYRPRAAELFETRPMSQEALKNEGVNTSEATNYLKTKYRCCKTNCLCRTMPDDRGRQWHRLRSVLWGASAPVAHSISEEAR